MEKSSKMQVLEKEHTKDHYYNYHCNSKNDGKQGFGTTFERKSMHCWHTLDVSKPKVTKMENKGHLIQHSLWPRQTDKNQSGQFSRYVAASHWSEFSSLHI